MRTKIVWTFTAAIAGIVLIGTAGWFALRSFDDSMSSVHVTEDAGGAKRIAERMGVRLNGSEVAYGEVTSQFQGWPMAYLVTEADNTVVRDRIIRQSRLHCVATEPAMLASLRAPSRHGPPPSTSLMTCTRSISSYADTVPAGERGGDLTVWFDPTAGARDTWLYISAVPI